MHPCEGEQFSFQLSFWFHFQDYWHVMHTGSFWSGNEDTSLQDLQARSQVVTKRCRALKYHHHSHSPASFWAKSCLLTDRVCQHCYRKRVLSPFPALQRSSPKWMFLSSNSHVDPEVKSLQKSIALKLIGTKKYGSVGVLTIYTPGCHSPALLHVFQSRSFILLISDLKEQKG